MHAPSLSHPGAVSEALAAYLDAERAYAHVSRVCAGQWQILTAMADAGIPIPKRCKDTNWLWRKHREICRQALEHARANCAMAEALASP